MKLLDQGLPRSTVLYLCDAGAEALNAGEIGLSTASDSDILTFAAMRTWSSLLWIRIFMLYWRYPELLDLPLSAHGSKDFEPKSSPPC